MAERPNETEAIDVMRGSVDAMLHAIEEKNWAEVDKHLERAHRLAIVSIASDFRNFMKKMEKKS